MNHETICYFDQKINGEHKKVVGTVTAPYRTFLTKRQKASARKGEISQEKAKSCVAFRFFCKVFCLFQIAYCQRVSYFLKKINSMVGVRITSRGVAFCLFQIAYRQRVSYFSRKFSVQGRYQKHLKGRCGIAQNCPLPLFDSTTYVPSIFK